tara:strand:- start:49 stop:621 length:573 start_codon:yes stop_codon:yes gene_type:complete
MQTQELISSQKKKYDFDPQDNLQFLMKYSKEKWEEKDKIFAIENGDIIVDRTERILRSISKTIHRKSQHLKDLKNVQDEINFMWEHNETFKNEVDEYMIAYDKLATFLDTQHRKSVYFKDISETSKMKNGSGVDDSLIPLPKINVGKLSKKIKKTLYKQVGGVRFKTFRRKIKSHCLNLYNLFPRTPEDE